MNGTAAAQLVGILMAAYPSNKATAQTSVVYESMLRDLDYKAAGAAVERLIATAKWMPTVAEIREATLAIMTGEQKPGGEAWGAVLKAMKAEGAYRAPGVDFVFSDPVTAECVDALDWRALCGSENQVADRARFIELYDRLAVHARQRQLSESLPAMQAYRAIEAKRRKEIAQRTGSTDSSVFGKVLQLVADTDGES